ncbi:MAG: LamG-like jellyroll fold domain-containing protein [Pseudomonadota bacterium]
MSQFSRLFVFLFATVALVGLANAQQPLTIGANVNMVSGNAFPNGDPFLRQQNEPSVAFSSRNSLHLLSGANDYRAVDVPGLPGGRETGDSWLSYFWSTNGGATWQSTLIPGYPQDLACQSANPPALCGYAAGADPVVRAGVNGMFYYSGIVFERSDPSRSAIFVSRFIDLNNDEGGDPIRYLDTTIIDANNDGSVFLDKSWIGVDIPRASANGSVTDMFDVTQRNGSTVEQTVACGNVYVGYAAIEGEDDDLLSEIRLATSTDCGNTWNIQPISEPDTLNQGANIAIHPSTGAVHVVWRRFDTVESFQGISPTGCPASAKSWRINGDWPTSTVTVAGQTYTIAQGQELLRTRHRGDMAIKLAIQVVAAKLNLLTGGGDAVPGFNPWNWAQTLTGHIEEAEAWFVENPLGSRPTGDAKKEGRRIFRSILKIQQGSGTCTDSNAGSGATTTGETNAIMIVSSDDFGETFSAPQLVDESTTFDQGSTRYSFRTTAYPTVAVDADGRVYVAWAARGFATIRGEVSDGDARIVLSTSIDGVSWSEPYAVDEPNRQGHQIKPSMLFAGGQLTLVFYDFRQDVSNIFEGFVIDLPEEDRLRHTVDVRVATALPAAAPQFTDYSLVGSSNEPVNPSDSASRYAFVATADGASGETLQVEYMVPNFPMFADGTTPFIGDYVDIAAPNLINDNGVWRFASNAGDVQVWQAVWSDNRDVVPPPDGDWSKYVAPILEAQQSLFDPNIVIPSCTDITFPDALPEFQAGALYTGTRNQNVYSASISNGVIVAAPGNNRPLGLDNTGAPLERGFVVYVQNTTGQERAFRLSLPAIPAGVEASFAPDTLTTQTDVQIPPFSSAVATVFASATGVPASEAIPVSVAEIGGTLAGSVLLNSDAGAPGPLQTSLLTTETHNPAILNPAILNPAILNASVDAAEFMTCTDDPAKCVLNPAIFNPAIFNPAILNPAIFNPAIMNPAIFNPAILNPAVFNPAVMNPAVLNPAIMNPAILNPAILNPAVFNPAIFNPAVLNPAILNPAIMNPAVLNPAILNPAVLNPAIFNPAILNPAVLNPAILNSAPAPRQVDVTFTVTNGGNATTAYDLNLAAPQMEGLDYELVVYRLNETPVAQGCTLTTQAQQQLIFSQGTPTSNAVDGTFYLEPGEEVLVTFRVIPDVNSDVPVDPVATFVVDDLGGLVSSQPLNTNPASQPPADEFGPPANIVPATAGGTVIGGGGTAPLNAGLLAAGEQVSITATGFVQIGPSPGFQPTSPDGSSSPCNATCLLPTAPPASLVGRIGSGPWQFVGAGPTILTAATTGDLELAINDNGYNDNSGAFYVTVTPIVRSAPAVLPNLVNWWPGEGDASDIVGMNDGVLFGGTTFGAGLVNQAFQFDGVDDYMDVGRPLPRFEGAVSEGTVDMWVRRNGPVTSGSDVFIGSVGPNLRRAPTLFVRGGGTLLWEFGGVTVQNTGVPLNIGQWHHLAMTWQPSGANTLVQVYVDGALVDSITTGPPTNLLTELYVGAYNENFVNTTATAEQFANASIDEVDVFDLALTQAQIQSIFDAGAAGKEPPSPFREIVIQSETDITNFGSLLVANDLGGSPAATTVNGITFGVDQSGQPPGEWVNGTPGADGFAFDSISPALDELLDDLIFVNFGRGPVDTSFNIGGLTPGDDYRLQLLFSNDLNETGNNVEVTVEGETWLLDNWQPDAINLSIDFTATGTSVDVVFTGGPGSTIGSGRGVLNAYVLHDITIR